tara:strand:- start:495 stop:1466 length:972 start_codon:yes stop_codon:yes gene_type:complete
MLKPRSSFSPWENNFNVQATKEDILYCFRLLLGRYPSEDEWTGHSQLAGNQLEAIVTNYLQSLEFKNRNLIGATKEIKKTLTKFDFYIYTNRKDILIGKEIQKGLYEENVTNLFIKYLKEGISFIDIGANVGWFSLLTSKILKDNCIVNAIEPFSENCKLLMASAIENNINSIQIMQAAAYSSNGIMSFGASGGNGMCNVMPVNIDYILRSETVNSIKLDDFINEKVDLIKIDVEGAEYSALLGASKLIQKWKPTIFSEFTPDALKCISGVNWKDYLNFIIDLNYKIKVIQDTVIDCQFDIDKVYKIFQESNSEHLDLLFYTN